MKRRELKNIAASIRQRLLNEARSSGHPFNELLQYFAMERLLFRLSRSPHAGSFVLKGALMLAAWGVSLSRTTKDIDLLGHVPNDVERIVAIINEVCRQEVEPDGLDFDTASVQGERIAEEAEYDGVRVRFQGNLGTAWISMQIDVGVGDAVVPGPATADYPTILAEAVRATFARRDLDVNPRPVALTDEFAADAAKAAQWRGFLRKSRLERAPDDLAEVVAAIADFLGPVSEAIHEEGAFGGRWRASGPWSPP